MMPHAGKAQYRRSRLTSNVRPHQRTQTPVATITSTFPYFWATYGCFLIGLLYFFAASPGTTFLQRLAGSAYAPVVGVLFLAVTFTDPEHWSFKGIPLFLALQLVPLALLVHSLRRYPARRWTHVMLLPLALLCWGSQAFWGYLGTMRA